MATVSEATSDVHAGAVTPLSDWLEALPTTLFRGFDRKATRMLVARLDASYSDLMGERDHLLSELTRLQGLCDGLQEREHELIAEVERLSAELGSAQGARNSLAHQLECARSKWDVELERARADLRRELEAAEQELAAYRRRDVLLAELTSSARSKAEAITAEARDEAERLLRQARKRDRRLLENVQRELDRLESERLRLQALAADFRQDLVTRLTATLDELNRPRSGETAEAPERGERG